jgi:hypothetical protein
MGEGEAAAPPKAANGGQAGPRDEELVTPNRGLNDDLKVTSVESASVPAPAPRFSLGSLVWTKITGTRFCSDLYHDFIRNKYTTIKLYRVQFLYIFSWTCVFFFMLLGLGALDFIASRFGSTFR